MLLLVDIGNTQFKWRLQASVANSKAVARGSLGTAQLTAAQLQEQLNQKPRQKTVKGA